MINDKEDEVIDYIFHSLLSRYQIGLETAKKGSYFIFGCVYILHLNVIKEILNDEDHT